MLLTIVTTYYNAQERLLPSSSSSVTDEHFNALQAITREQLVSSNHFITIVILFVQDIGH